MILSLKREFPRFKMLIINKLIPNSVEGSSDDLDMPIKKVLSDVPFSGKHRLLSLNSINWGRIMMQTVHFVYSYFFAAAKTDDDLLEREVEIAVPTGACGNITGKIQFQQVRASCKQVRLLTGLYQFQQVRTGLNRLEPDSFFMWKTSGMTNGYLSPHWLSYRF